MLPLRALRLFGLPLFLASVPPLRAQIVTEPDLPEKPRLEIEPTVENGLRLTWFGREGFSYFLQTTTDLVDTPWQYLPMIETGQDAELHYGFVTTAPRFFARIVLTEQTATDPLTADFDSDGISNGDEFTHQTDPLSWDTDGDGMPDGWEVAHSLSPTSPADALLDSDGDGASDYAEFSRGTDPHVLNPIVGLSIAIKGLSSEADYDIVQVGPTGTAFVRDGDGYRVWTLGGLSHVLFSVPPPAPPEDGNPADAYSHTATAWINEQGWTVHNLRSELHIFDDDALDPHEWESTTHILDDIRIVNPTSLSATTISLPTYTWTSLWDGYLYPEHHSYRVGKVHGVDNNGYIWAELAPTDIDHRGLYKIPLSNPSAPVLTNYSPYNFIGVTRTGIALGKMVGEDSDVYSVNGVPVDYRPFFAGDGGAVWGLRHELREIAPGSYISGWYYRAYFPDGVEMPAPEFDDWLTGTDATHFDRWNRLHGSYVENGIRKRAVWERKDLGSSTYEWVRSDYQTLILGNGQWTDHRVPPGLWEPQAGIVNWTNAEGVEQSASTIFIPGGIAVDANGDGLIKLIQEDDSDAIYPGQPLRLASNDDDDNPGSSFLADYLNSVVDGVDDLPDFFPVFLDIKQLLTVLPPSATVKYKLKQADGKLNFVYTSLTRATAFDYEAVGPAGLDYGPNANQAAAVATTQQITAAGVELPASFLTRIKDQDQGVILIELRGMTAAPLKLVVEKDNVQIAEVAVNIATGEIEWESLYANNPVEDFKVPEYYSEYTIKNLKWLEGLRYFSDGDGPDATFHRTRINVKVKMAGAAGKSVKLKAFDVDDPTPGDWDDDHADVVDPNDAGNGPTGNDNNTGSLFAGTFAASALNTITTTLDGNGEATVEFITTQRPGSNYRIAAVLNDSASQLDALQVTNATGARYVGPDAKPVPGFAGLMSPTLTIWRKLYIEVDSMTQAPNPITENIVNGAATSFVDNVPTHGSAQIGLNTGLPGEANRFEYANLVVSGVSLLVKENTDNTFSNDTLNVWSINSGITAGQVVGQPFTLTDDDNRFNALHGWQELPLNNTHAAVIAATRPKYAPAYIEIIDANAAGLNTRTTVPFDLNEGVIFSVFDDSIDVEGSEFFWAHAIIFGLQPGTSEDGDPYVEGMLFGGTAARLQADGWEGLGYSAIYLESNREESVYSDMGDVVFDPARFSSPISIADRSNKYKNLLMGTIAHEIGHGPTGGERDDHDEGGLMRAGGAAVNDDFSGASIMRFRSTKEWR